MVYVTGLLKFYKTANNNNNGTHHPRAPHSERAFLADQQVDDVVHTTTRYYTYMADEKVVVRA